MKSRLAQNFFGVLLFASALIFSFQSIQASAEVLSCQRALLKTEARDSAIKILKERQQNLPERFLTVQKLAQFAEKYKLSYRWHDFGPADRKIRRLLVAVDITNAELMQAYRSEFNLEKGQNEDTLAIEQTWESSARPEHYVYTYIRAFSDPQQPVYRWGKKDLTWEQSFASLKGSAADESGLVGLAHLIELNKVESENVKIFLDQANLRGPCKSTNCVAWITGTELGKTALDVSDAERKYLFNELGVSRTIAPFEISRRLLHASNDRYGATVVFVEGAKGETNFKDQFEKYLIPEPKIPYGSILKNYTAVNPADQAMDVIGDGYKIFLPIAAGASPEAVEALIARSEKMEKGIDLHVLVNGVSAQTFKKGVETTNGKFRVHALFLGGNLRELYRENKVSVIPGNLSDFTRIMRQSEKTDFHYDAIVVRVSLPNPEGYHSLGPNHDMIMTILRDRPNIKIIAEVNPNIPFTVGSNRIHSSRFSSSFESKTELAGPTTVPMNEIDQRIGHSIGKLIDSGATLQIGIGNIFGAVPEGLKLAGKSNIRLSTEMLGDPMMEMLKDGTATQAEAGFAFGSVNLYRWLHENEKVKFVSTEYVNSPGRVSRIKKFHAVNTALQVDLFGQVNATMGPEGRISSPGGQVEFMSGASRSEGGKAIIAIRSTAKNETISSITLKLYDGPITTPHENVTHVVTEYGVAELRGKTEKERALALINIAHPKFRQDLFAQAVQIKILSNEDSARIQK